MLDRAKIMAVFLSQVIRNGFCSMRPCVIGPLATSLTSSLSISTSFYLCSAFYSGPDPLLPGLFTGFFLLECSSPDLCIACPLATFSFNSTSSQSPSLATKSKIADSPPCFILTLFALITLTAAWPVFYIFVVGF